MKELNQKLAVIQTKLKTKKTSYNAFGKYYFRKAEDILEAIKPFLLEQGVSVTINEEIIATDPVPTLQSTATITDGKDAIPVSYTHLRAHETVLDLVCRLLLFGNETYRTYCMKTF